jgi:DNA-binding GntR family transcriptional regulator
VSKELPSRIDKQIQDQSLLPPTRADWVEKQLRRDILFGVFAPGERLLAADLAKRYTVSPTPLREALQRLATDGLLTMTPQRGVRVAPLPLHAAEEIYELRCLLEPLALRKSLEHADEEWRAKVQQTYEQITEVTSDEHHEVVAAEDANRAFHQALLSRCESHWLLNIVSMLSDHCIRYRFLSFKGRGGRAGIQEEHRAIYEACMHGDSDTAAQSLERHLKSTLASIIAVLQLEGTQEDDNQA